MYIKKVEINNYKSIDKLDFELDKIGKSYTRILVGINESGKSNILEALALYNSEGKPADYGVLHNQKDEDYKNIEILYYLTFKSNESFNKDLSAHFPNQIIPDFTISEVRKRLYLENGASAFSGTYTYTIKNIKYNKSLGNNNDKVDVNKVNQKVIATNENIEDEESFKKVFDAKIKEIIKNYEPKVSLWSPSPKFLISDVALNEFKKNPDSNIPLKHIFILGGYETNEAIAKEIGQISTIQFRRKLASKLSESTTKYIKGIWKHDIEIDIEISETGHCSVSVKDAGQKNKHNYHKMSSRSEGFKQFVSLILSLSIESKKLNMMHNLILIDEPETHLHPSGIRDLREELLRIGQNNYLFISTHSPFLIDRTAINRNIIIKKNRSAITEKKLLTTEEDVRDDEVLDLAFGINVYKDLMVPNRILVEGASDKLLLKKALFECSMTCGITNGIGSNIVQIASKLNSDEISILVVVDDDDAGQKYKEEILKISGVFCENNVLTIRDLVGEVMPKSTIEDLLPKEYIKSKYKSLLNKELHLEDDIEFDDNPVMQQIKIDMQRKRIYTKELLDTLKKNISEDFKPTKTTITTKSPLLYELARNIKDKLA